MRFLFRQLRVLVLRLLAILYGKPLPAFNHVIVLAPHPDDEVFGCFELIRRQVQQGSKVSILFLSDGENSHRHCCNTDSKVVASQRRILAESINLGIEVRFLHISDGLIFADAFNIERVREVLVQLLDADASNSEVAMFVPHRYEGWSDHENTFRIGQALSEKDRVSPNVKINLYEYCVWFWISMPFRNAIRCCWRSSRYLLAKKAQDKEQAVKMYIEPEAPCGKPWAGQLPKQFVDANLWKREIYFSVSKPE